MAKFVWAVLTLILLNVDARAESVAGGVPTVPEPGIVTQTLKSVRRVALRLKGVAFGCLIRAGMPLQQVLRIVGPGVLNGGLAKLDFYNRDLGLTVHFAGKFDTTDVTYVVSGVSFRSFLDR
jgi:hypothetical protein